MRLSLSGACITNAIHFNIGDIMKNNESKPFRDLASFGKRMEYKIIAEML